MSHTRATRKTTKYPAINAGITTFFGGYSLSSTLSIITSSRGVTPELLRSFSASISIVRVSCSEIVLSRRGDVCLYISADRCKIHVTVRDGKGVYLYHPACHLFTGEKLKVRLFCCQIYLGSIPRKHFMTCLKVRDHGLRAFVKLRRRKAPRTPI